MVQDIYNGQPIESPIWSIERHSLTLYISQTATDTATVTIEGE